MRVKVILENATDCELASETFDLPDGSEADDGSEKIQDIIGGWTLSVGDTIKITEG